VRITRVRLVASVDHLERKIGEPLWYRKGRSVGVNHRGRYSVGEPRCATGREGLQLVEVHHAEPSQRIGRAVELAVPGDPRIDGDGRWEPGVDIEVHRLGRCLIYQAVECGTSGVGLQAQGGADRVAGADRQGDLRPGVDLSPGSDVLGGIDRHFHVDVKETQPEKGMEVVRERRRAVVEVRYGPGSCQYGDRSAEEQLKPAGDKLRQPEARATGSVGLSAGTSSGSRCSKPW
jgi:hypothetical protein